MGVVVYISSVSSNKTVKGHQQRLQMILSSKKIEFEVVDISTDDTSKAKMRELSGNSSQLPPIICNDDTFCGDFEAFENAVDDERLMEFLKLA